MSDIRILGYRKAIEVAAEVTLLHAFVFSADTNAKGFGVGITLGKFTVIPGISTSGITTSITESNGKTATSAKISIFPSPNTLFLAAGAAFGGIEGASSTLVKSLFKLAL
jgi:hypothetical protein